jgi:nucleotide-binding universal stress UspA family protein
MKNILLLVHEDQGQEARLQTALDLARAFKGHIQCADVTALSLYPADPSGWSTGLALIEDRKLETDLRVRLEVRLASEAVSWEWAESIGDLAVCLENQSLLSDLVVVNCRRDAFFADQRRGLVGDLAYNARCPVVAVPDRAVGINLGDAAMVAWDGSEPAAATLRAAIPLLGLARDVHVVSVGAQDSGPSAKDAAAYLSRHGLRPEVHLIERGKATPDEVLLSLAENLRAGYCVMGAYGHGRLSKALFGGVTRRMIEAAALPLVLDH